MESIRQRCLILPEAMWLSGWACGAVEVLYRLHWPTLHDKGLNPTSFRLRQGKESLGLTQLPP